MKLGQFILKLNFLQINWRRRDPDNALHRHDVEHHNGECQAYTAMIVTREISLLTLTVREAILQEHQREEVSMNDRIEMGRGGEVPYNLSSV